MSNTPLRPRKTDNVIKSAEVDEADEIYKNVDPIGVSLEKRLKLGPISSVVTEKNSKP